MQWSRVGNSWEVWLLVARQIYDEVQTLSLDSSSLTNSPPPYRVREGDQRELIVLEGAVHPAIRWALKVLLYHSNAKGIISGPLQLTYGPYKRS
jgi:hypothetical protein